MNNITLHFDKLYSSPRIGEPCYIGIPFSKGQLYDSTKLYLYQNSQLLCSQTKVTSTYEDGSIRYVLVRFLADLPANQKTQVICTREKLVTSEISTPSALSCTETEQGISVSTGAISFMVTHHSSHLFDSLTAFGKHYEKEHFCGPYLNDHYTMFYERWHVVENGAVCTVLSCQGMLVPCDAISNNMVSNYDTTVTLSNGMQIKQGLLCEVRLTAYAGKSWVDTSIRLTNATDMPLTISSYGFSFVHTDHQNNRKDEGRIPRLCVASSNYKTDFVLSKQGEPVEKIITADMLLNQGNEHFAEVLYGTFFADHTSFNGGVCATVFQAFQNFPKAVKASSSGLDVMLVPEGTSVVMQSGMAREQNLQLYFHPAEEPLSEINNRSLIYQMPDRPVLDADIYARAGVMPDIFVKDKDLDTEDALILSGDAHARAYGMMNWGDAPDPNYTAQGRGHGRLIWTNNEYDFPHACFLMYAKTGIRRFLDYALVAGRHQIDVDVCHYSTDCLLLGGQWEHTQGHTQGGAIVCSHEWVEGILDCYHATGDERFYETALGIGDNILRLLDTPMYQANGALSARETGWALRTLTALYTETKDTKWVAKAEWIVGQFQEWSNRYGGWLAPYTDNVVIRVPFMISIAVGSLMRYYREFPRNDIRVMMISAVDDMIENCLMEDGLFYYKELPSLNRLGNNPLTLEALAIAYELTGNKKYLRAGFRTYAKVIQNLSSSGGGGKRMTEDAVLSGSTGTKQFAQTFIPVATYYRALEQSGLQ